MYHLFAQHLPNPYHEFLKSLRFFEEGNFVYDKVLSVRQEVIRADRNPCRKTGKNHPECRKQFDFLIFGSCSFLHRSQNRVMSVLLESRHHKLSRNTTFTQIQYLELGQPNSRNTTKISQSARKLPITTIQCTTFLHSIFPILTMSF